MRLELVFAQMMFRLREVDLIAITEVVQLIREWETYRDLRTVLAQEALMAAQVARELLIINRTASELDAEGLFLHPLGMGERPDLKALVAPAEIPYLIPEADLRKQEHQVVQVVASFGLPRLGLSSLVIHKL